MLQIGDLGRSLYGIRGYDFKQLHNHLIYEKISGNCFSSNVISLVFVFVMLCAVDLQTAHRQNI